MVTDIRTDTRTYGRTLLFRDARTHLKCRLLNSLNIQANVNSVCAIFLSRMVITTTTTTSTTTTTATTTTTTTTTTTIAAAEDSVIKLIHRIFMEIVI